MSHKSQSTMHLKEIRIKFWNPQPWREFQRFEYSQIEHMVPTLVVQGSHHFFSLCGTHPNDHDNSMRRCMYIVHISASYVTQVCMDWYGTTTRRSKTKSRPQPSPGAIAWFFHFSKGRCFEVPFIFCFWPWTGSSSKHLLAVLQNWE